MALPITYNKETHGNYSIFQLQSIMCLIFKENLNQWLFIDSTIATTLCTFFPFGESLCSRSINNKPQSLA